MVNSYKNRIVDLSVTKLSDKGNGLALLERSDNPPIEVEIPFTMPGDFVRVELKGKRRGVYKGRLQEILTASPQRVASKCAHFGVCGGCRLQHIPYENQLNFKEELVRRCFDTLLTPEVVFHPIVVSQESWRYRNKMDYTFSTDATGNKYLGLVKEGSKGRVCNLEECHLVHPWFTDALKCVKYWWDHSDLSSYNIFNNTGSLRLLTLREGQRTGDRMVVLTVSGDPSFSLQSGHLESFIASIRNTVEPTNPSSHLSIVLRVRQVAPGMTSSVYEMLLYGPGYIREALNIKVSPSNVPVSLSFEIGPSAFFQPNPRLTEHFYSLALSLAEIPPDAVVYDIYCGAGILGLCISKYVKHVIGNEISPETAQIARANAKRNGCKNVTIISGAARHTLHKLKEQSFPTPDVVLVNPPRAGLDPEAMERFLELLPPKILYISCNPFTHASNISKLVQNGYRLAVVQPVDQFPQTPHVENIAVLIRNQR